jgi:hypothetical protein
MITTTIVWPEKGRDGFTVMFPSEEEQQLLYSKVEELAPGFDTDLILESEGPNGRAIRTWPTQETAQSFVDYVLANFTVVSAVVNSD